MVVSRSKNDLPTWLVGFPTALVSYWDAWGVPLMDTPMPKLINHSWWLGSSAVASSDRSTDRNWSPRVNHDDYQPSVVNLCLVRLSHHFFSPSTMATIKQSCWHKCLAALSALCRENHCYTFLTGVNLIVVNHSQSLSHHLQLLYTLYTLLFLNYSL